ncbi:MAG: ATP-binding cassette domain-containing protein, partial [Brachybacterium tyrofermentans]
MISIDAVRKTYTSSSGTVEIGPVTLEIPAGGVTALVGPNGAGKSTMLTMAGRLLGIDEGAIEVAGYDI